ncbi:MAG: hypothetical protein EOO44_06265 [Flavobacterium sp.]|nr:MAG: hypothetical protein EOO44_06265 [Flavobacterium sp.]
MVNPNLNPYLKSELKDSEILNNPKHFKQRVQRAITKILAKEKKPLSRRAISNLTSIEICTLCFPLLDLERCKILQRAYKRICPETGKSVIHYGLKSWEVKDEL